MSIEKTPANVTAIEHNGLRYLPLASIVDQLGGTITWDHASKRADLVVRGRNARVDMNDNIVTVDGNEAILTAPPILDGGHIYVTPDFLDQIGLTYA